jgi:hypothetical protein
LFATQKKFESELMTFLMTYVEYIRNSKLCELMFLMTFL